MIAQDMECSADNLGSKERKLNLDIVPYKTSFEPGEMIFPAAMVAFITSVSRFWIQPEPAMVDEITMKLDSLVPQPLPAEALRPGTSCLALFPDDERWYRAVIRSVDGDDISVFYVDYGNATVVNQNQIGSLSAELALYPAMGVLCSLTGIGIPSPRRNRMLTDEFIDLVDDVLVSVLFTKAEGDYLSVRLCKTDGTDVNNKLLQMMPLVPAVAPTILDDSLVDEYLMMMSRG